MTLGDCLRFARENAELSQTAVKEKTGINNKTLSNWEHNVSCPSPSDLSTLADLYHVTTDTLLGRSSPHSASQETQDLLSLLLRHSPAASEAMKNFRVDASGSILRNGEKVSDLSDPVLLAAAKMIYDRLSEAQAAGASSAHIDITRRP